MKTRARHEFIVDRVRTAGRVPVEDLAKELAVSKETIRRDLGQLSERGLVRKVHGAAALPQVLGESKFDQRMSSHILEKRAIAHLAAELFTPNETLFIDTGSTTAYFAEQLALIGAFTIVTNFANIATTLTTGPNPSRVFLLGGEFNPNDRQTVGEFVLQQIRLFRAQHAVLTIGAIDEDGVIMDYSLEEALIARAMIEQAQSVTVIVDSSKLGKRAMFEVAGPDAYQRLVCDKQPGEKLSAQLKANDVEVLVAALDDRAQITH